MSMMTRVFAVLILALVPSGVWAQPLVAGQPVRVAFEVEHGPNNMGYRAMLNGQVHKVWTAEELTFGPAPLDACRVGAEVCRSVEAVIPGLPEGEHALTVETFNALGSAASEPLTVTALAQPQPPSTPRVIRIEIALRQDGTLDLQSVRVSFPAEK
jgi:hypothetical protein